MLLWLWSWTGVVLEQWCEVLVFNLNGFRDYFIWTWFVIALNRTLMFDVIFVNWCNMWHVCWIMYDLGCMLTVNRDPSWYSTDYRVYMSSSMIVWPFVSYPYTCAIINWTVLLHFGIKTFTETEHKSVQDRIHTGKKVYLVHHRLPNQQSQKKKTSQSTTCIIVLHI